MLPKSNRLPHVDIGVLSKTGKRIYSESFQCIIKTGTHTVSRMAIVVGKKISKSAVKRNRMKRIVHEAFRHLLSKIPTPIDCMIVVKKDFSTHKTQHVIHELERNIVSKI